MNSMSRMLNVLETCISSSYFRYVFQVRISSMRYSTTILALQHSENVRTDSFEAVTIILRIMDVNHKLFSNQVISHRLFRLMTNKTALPLSVSYPNTPSLLIVSLSQTRTLWTSTRLGGHVDRCHSKLYN